MLRVMHKYKKSLFGFLIIGLVCMMMTGFGVDFLNKRHQPYAVKIDEHVITYEELAQERRNLEERYRNMFGKNYAQLAEQLNLNLGQQAVDKSINDYLIERQASDLNLSVGDESLSALIKNSLFGKDREFDINTYRAFLRQVGMSSQSFEQQVRQDALRQQFLGILRLASLPSIRESRAAIEREDTKFAVEYIESDPATHVKQVKDPEAGVLEEFFKTHNSEYELPPRISFDYVVLDPDKFLDLVEVTPEDVELYYSDHQSEFMTEEQVHARHIQLNYSKEATPTEMAELKTKAEEIYQKALSGEVFDSLALQYSDDITTKGNGGDLGWISRGKMSKEFDAAAFKTKQGGVSELVSADYGFHIIKVEDIKASEAKALPAVRAEIEMMIRKREAPAYTTDRAHALFEKWVAGPRSLADFAVENNLAAASTTGLLAGDKDPDDNLRGLTAKIIAFPEEEKQTVDIGDKTVLVSVKLYRDQEVPPLEQVKAKVIENWKKQQSVKLARETAESILEGLTSGKQDSLKAAALAAKLPLKEAKDVSISNRSKAPPFNNLEAAQELLSIEQLGKKPTKVLDIDGKFYLAQVTAAAKPEPSDVEAKLVEYRRRGSDSFLQILAMSMTNRLKTRSVIDVVPGLLSEQS